MKKYWLLVFAPCLILQPVTTWAVDPAGGATSKGQGTAIVKGPVSLVSRTEIKSLDKQKIVAFKQQGVPSLGSLQYNKEDIHWLPTQASPVKLPHRLPTLIAANGRTVLQYGDSRHRIHPERMNLFFVDESGVEKGRVVDRYGPQTDVAIADDGYVAIAGQLFKNPQQSEVALYTATGEKRFQSQLVTGRRASMATPATQGQRVAVFTTDTKNLLASHRLELLDGTGKKLAEHKDLGILQKAIAVANGSMFFIQAKNRFALVDANDGSLLWTRDKVLRLVSPFGAATDPQNKTLFLAAVEWDGKPKALYKWRIEVRDIATGKELASFQLPDSYPSSHERIFIQVTDNKIELLAGNERVELDWSRP